MKTKNALLLISTRFLSLIVAFFMMPYILSWVGADAYGIFLFAGVFSAYTAVFDFGPGLQRGLVRAAVKQDWDSFRSYQRTYALYGVYVTVAALTLYVVVAAIYRTEKLPVVETTLIFAAVALNTAMSVYLNAFGPTFAAVQKLHYSTLITTLKDAVGVAIGILTAYYTRSMVWVAMSALVTTLLGIALNALVARRAGIPADLRPRREKEAFEDCKTIAIRNVGNNFLGYTATKSDRMLIGAFVRPPSVLADYNFAIRPVEILIELLRGTVTALTPQMIRAVEESDVRAAEELRRNGLIMWTLGVMGVFLPAVVGDHFLKLWLKGAAPENGGLLMALMGLYFALDLQYLSFGPLFYAKGTPHRLVKFAAFNAAVTLTLTLPLYHWIGLVGVAAMNVGINLLLYIPRMRTCQRELSVPLYLRDYTLRSIGVLALGLSLFAAGTALFQLPLFAARPILTIPVAAGLCIAGFLLCFSLKLCPVPLALLNRWNRLLRR